MRTPGRLFECRLRWARNVTVAAILASSGLSASQAPLDARQKLLAAGVEEIVFACRTPSSDQHWYANFGYYFDGPGSACFGDSGALRKLNVAGGTVTDLLVDAEGAVRDPQVHYDRKEILFSYRRGGESQYHLHEIGSDGSGLRQLTDGIYDDIEPSYLPDDDIVFVSARSRRWVNCWQTQVATLYRCDRDGKSIRVLSANIEQDNTPWMLPDGRLLFTRWEYVDRSQVSFHHLWTMNPDGTGQMVYFGNMRPKGVFIDAKPVPGTDDVVFIHSPDHGNAEHAGAVAVVSGKHGPDSWKSYRQISRGGRDSLRDPYPISDDCFLVAEGRRLLVMDGNGNESLLLEADTEIHEPRPLIARPRERVLPSRVSPEDATGIVFLKDIYVGRRMLGIPRGEIKKLLVLETLPKPLNFGDKLWDFIPISHGGTFTLARILGSVPVEKDGSAYFELPALRPLFFVAVDKDGSSVKRMHSFLSVMPGETTGCVGCHEERFTTPSNEGIGRPLALARPPSVLEPLPGVPYVHDYPRDIQPILDRHCVECHEPEHPGGRVLLTGDHGAIFSQSYFTLTSRRLVSDGRNGVGNSAPRAVGDSASPLMEMLAGDHYGAKLSRDEIMMIRSWIHVGAPYPGTYAALGTGMLHEALPFPPDYDRIRSAALSAFERRCAECHAGYFPELNRYSISSKGHENLLDSHLAFNFSRPDKSPLLLAPLAREAGGWGVQEEDDGGPGERWCIEAFHNTSDPDYEALLEYVELGKAVLDENKRWDMPGFQPSRHYVREMKRFGILPESFNLARDSIDVYEIDRKYWESFWHRPHENAGELYHNATIEKLLVVSRADVAWETDLAAIEVGALLDSNRLRSDSTGEGETGQRYEGESAFRVAETTMGDAHPQNLRKFGRNWSGDSHLLWKGAAPGASLSLEFTVEAGGRRAVTIQLTKAPDYGIVQLYLDGTKLLDPIDLYAVQVETTPPIDAGEIALDQGKHELRIEIVGSNSSARAGGFGKYLFGLDYLALDAINP